jgi:hypothetical protein
MKKTDGMVIRLTMAMPQAILNARAYPPDRAWRKQQTVVIGWIVRSSD